MGDGPKRRLDLAGGSVEIDIATGAVSVVDLARPATRFVGSGERESGLVRVAAPLPDYPSHYLEVGTHAAPEIEQVGDGVRLRYGDLTSEYGSLAARTQVDLMPTEAGLVIKARVENASAETIPQVAFPQLLGLEAVGGTEGTRLQLGRRQVLPFCELAMRPDDAWWLERRLQEYIPYGIVDFNMKWLDFGDEIRGLTLFSRSPGYASQGLVLDRVGRDVDRLDVRWVHYPFIEPGETWHSDEYLLLPHEGDWYAGARAYQEFAATEYPYRAPRHIREALGIRSVWSAVRNSPPTFPISEVSSYAEEIADGELGLAELVVWHWWLKNGYPIIFDERLGTEQDMVDMIGRCHELGVPVSLFVSHNILRDTDETDPSWVHRNPAGQAVGDNWTYGPDFLPRFRVLFMGTHAMVQASPLSKGWRETGLAEYRRILDDGADGICFDVFRAPPGPDFNPAADGRPDKAGDRLLEFAEQAREMIHEQNPEGSFSGEFAADVKVPVLDYTWEWKNSYDMPDAAPFRYVFPQFRLNANVGTHPRGALRGFMEGALLNVIPGDMRSHKLANHPDLVAMLRPLAALRRRFLRYFTEGQFRYREGLDAQGCDARLYTAGEDILVIAINPGDEPIRGSFAVDPSAWGAPAGDWTATAYTLDGQVETIRDGSSLRQSVELGPDDLRVFEFVSAGDKDNR